MRIDTLAVHAGETPDLNAGAVAAPISLSTTFERAEDGTLPHGHLYSRYSNPNRDTFEACVQALEGGACGVAFASGMGAIAAVLESLAPGDHVVVASDAYYGTATILTGHFERWGLEHTFVDFTDLEAVAASMRPNTVLVWGESPTNPMLKVVDVEGVAAIAHAGGALLGIDNTFATPVLQRPLALGADIVMHSATKYLGGHSDVMAGVLVFREEQGLAERVRTVQMRFGGVASPFDCWLVMRGIKTLPLRVRAQSGSALAIARWLEAHPRVERVHYPGLPSHPGHDIAVRQMERFGGMLSVQVRGEAAEAIAVAARLKLFVRATSLGGVHSLVEHRASVEPPGSSTPANLLRLSIGLEHQDDLIADLEQALGA
ncbi:MAG TPA: PLP-dependent aspartate aminotransferase family protein [Candidatus Kapabacteria bacterium]|nr:PLP-dependent aspartate aminotransferase family protein [Candidatus Kapabacteria bacterium]